MSGKRATRRHLRQIEQETARLRDSLHAPLNQEQRAARVRRVEELRRDATALGANDAAKDLIALFEDAVVCAYPPGFWSSYEELKAGHTDGLELAVQFLVDDPWFHRSGYVKENLLRFIGRLDNIPDHYIPRLESVLLNAVDSRDRREFRRFCNLARAIATERLREQVALRLQHEDSAVRRRAGWMLAALDQ